MILITGGAGYIGSHTNKQLNQKGYSTVILDNLVYGHMSAVKWGSFVLADLSDIEQIRLVFNKFKITSVIHFAAYAYVGESVQQPEKYYFNNVVNTLNLLKVMQEFDVNKIIFSSTCATYGDPVEIPITESHIQNPINPYGKSKLIIENALSDYSKAYNLKYVALRYFNAAGADINAEIGEDHDPETHLIPLVLDAAKGKRESIKIFGTDYDTDDGTAVRDYIHVSDLADAHILALEYLESGGDSDVFNLGNGNGYSVKDVIETARKVTEKDIVAIEEERRPGDPDKLIGSSMKAKKILGWEPKYHQLEIIIKSAWKWHKDNR
jgi:UDP-glucose 4-epimerase